MEQFTKKEAPKTFLDVIDYLETKGLPDLLIIDLDGVLVETSLKIFLKGLYLYLWDQEGFQKYINEHKIPFSYLRKLATLAQKTKIVILTNRLIRSKRDNLKNTFPFISQELIEKFKEKFGIEIIAQAFKPIVSSRIKDLILKHSRVAYIGSSLVDQITVERLNRIKPGIQYFQVSESNFI